MTSLELAHEFQAEELYDVLSATIHRPVPSHVLNVLQEEFHSLIRRDLGDLVAGERINLPILEGLTELKDEVLWFPIRYRDSYAVSAYCTELSETQTMSASGFLTFERVIFINSMEEMWS